MPDIAPDAGSQDLQFDRVTPVAARPTADSTAVTCRGCQASVITDYFLINGMDFCEGCRIKVEVSAQTPRSARAFVTAALFGMGAGIAGAAIYYGVMAFAHLEIGLIAVLIGYMVGTAVRKGAGGRGGRRFQVLAVVLTYVAVALAYTPLLISGLRQAKASEAAGPARAGATAPTPPSTTASPKAVAPAPLPLVLALLFFAGLILALPILAIIGSMPSGILSAIIIFFGLRQAWRMTRAPTLDVQGPYRVGGDGAPSPA